MFELKKASFRAGFLLPIFFAYLNYFNMRFYPLKYYNLIEVFHVEHRFFI